MISSVPIYDYRCEHCGHAFSAVQSFNDEALQTCPSCGKQPRRLITAPAIVFKGSGWYKTDSRPKDTSETASSEKKAETKPDATAKAKSDTKSDTKSETKSETKTETKQDTKAAPKASSGSGTGEAAS